MLVFDGFCDRIEFLKVCLYLYTVCILWHSTWSTELIHFQLIFKVCFLFLFFCLRVDASNANQHHLMKTNTE